MGTTIRPEISKKNRYWIDKHRYYELKHFCLQYPTWKKAHSSLDSMVRFAYDAAGSSRTNKIQRPVEDTVRDVVSASYFARVIDDGGAYYGRAGSGDGVLPYYLTN